MGGVMSGQAWTILGGVVGGGAGYFLGGRKPLWAAVGALAGAIVVPPAVAAASPQLGPSAFTGKAWVEQLVPGKTIILRAAVGDVVTVLAPSGWGVPSAGANVPGFMVVQSTDTSAEASILQITDAGQGQIQMENGGEVAVLSIEAT